MDQANAGLAFRCGGWLVWWGACAHWLGWTRAGARAGEQLYWKGQLLCLLCVLCLLEGKVASTPLPLLAGWLALLQAL